MRRLGLLVRRLVVRVGLQWLRVWRLVRWWSGVVDRQTRQGQLLRRRLVWEAVARRRRNHRRARRRERWCLRMVVLHRQRLVLLHRLPRWRVRLVMLWLRSLVRLRVRLWCNQEVAVWTLWLQRRRRVVMLVVPKQLRLVLGRLLRRTLTRGILVTTRLVPWMVQVA